MREVFRNVEAAVIREIQPRVCCPRCRNAAKPLGEERATLEWYRCTACGNLWAARSGHLV
jgi:transposase-like protein